MTHIIPVGSPRRAVAERFGRELERAMDARGVGTRPVSEAIGASRTSVMYWRTGRVLPRLESARKLAAALDWPRLEMLATELRRKACLVDAVEFVDDSGSDNRLYCSQGCQAVMEKRRLGGVGEGRQRGAVAEKRLIHHQRAVAAYCAGCEPSGRCVTADCALRPVSPLPLYANRLDIMPVQRRSA